MKRSFCLPVLLASFVAFSNQSFAQYPVIPKSVEDSAEAASAADRKASMNVGLQP